MVELDLPAMAADDGEALPGTAQLATILGAASVALAAAAVSPDGHASLALLLLGTTLACVAVLFWGRRLRQVRQRRDLVRLGARIIERDTVPGFLSDTQGTILDCNLAASQRFGARCDSLSEALSQHFATPATTLSRLRQRAAREGSVQDMVATRRGHLRLTVTRLGGGAMLWRIEDLAERPGTGRAADALGLPMLTAGPSGTILYMNEACRALTGGRARTLEAVFGPGPIRSGQVQSIPGEAGSVETLVAEIPAIGGRREIYFLPPASLSRDDVGTRSGIEGLPVPLLRLDRNGGIVEANRAACALLPDRPAPGTRLSDLLEGLGRPVGDWLEEAVEGRAVPGPQFLKLRGPGQDTVVQVTLGEADAQGQIVAVLYDATEQKSLEAQFVQAQKMQAIGQLAGGVAHDFNNLLTAISGHCDLLLLRHDKDDQDYSDLTQIHQNANRAASLVGQLLAYSRKQNLRLEQLDLRDTLSDLTHLLNRLVGEKVRLTLNHDPDLKQVRADRRQLEQVLMNLVVNARDAMSDGGEIVVETDNVLLEAPLERDRAMVPAGRWVRIRVKDHGCGIPADKLPKVFEPFYTTKRPGEGTGLGLSTVYGIVKQSGGYVFADSEPEKGSCFTLLLPSRAGEAEPARPAREGLPGPLAHHADGVVLLVEDEAPVRAFAARALRLRGLTVLEAEDAEAALAILSDPDLEVDIFVTDVIMPGKDGPTWVREALVDRPDTQVVFVSGYAEDTFAEQQSRIPNSVFLPKPFSLTDLAATVQTRIAC
ncbi:ATP-binding protein [uncultured Limimaricola sp.]|uniref:ATP-binding response regulator n=1 Tax=uncultured Limimaricola sp. TaxID=2211667 RepID=UPI0030FD00AF